MTYAQLLYNSARQRALRRHAAEQCELARLDLVRRSLATSDAIHKMLSANIIAQDTIEMVAIRGVWQPETVIDTEHMQVQRKREIA